MADFNKYAPKLLKLEGGYLNDNGKPTYRGILLEIYQRYGKDHDKNGSIDKADLLKMSKAEALTIYKKIYWNPLLADSIKNQSIAEILVDFKINGGLSIKKLQSIVGIKQDGKIGQTTIKAINKANEKKLFAKLLAWRKAYYQSLIKTNPAKYQQYESGWMDRLSSFDFVPSVATSISLAAIGGIALGVDYLLRKDKSIIAKITQQ